MDINVEIKPKLYYTNDESDLSSSTRHCQLREEIIHLINSLA